jgi:hypothetical protein
MVKSKRWKDAKEFYTKGIAVLAGKVEDKWDKPENEDEEGARLHLLEEQTYVNRALCNLELSESGVAVFLTLTQADRKLPIYHARLRRCSASQSQECQGTLSLSHGLACS